MYGEAANKLVGLPGIQLLSSLKDARFKMQSELSPSPIFLPTPPNSHAPLYVKYAT